MVHTKTCGVSLQLRRRSYRRLRYYTLNSANEWLQRQSERMADKKNVKVFQRIDGSPDHDEKYIHTSTYRFPSEDCNVETNITLEYSNQIDRQRSHYPNRARYFQPTSCTTCPYGIDSVSLMLLLLASKKTMKSPHIKYAHDGRTNVCWLYVWACTETDSGASKKLGFTASVPETHMRTSDTDNDTDDDDC